ncbi:hypothetical protein [Epilithonimonas mollis]|uniref:Uncharacterized protein n=1 Tax=Epilithonimonas mollis TaxID=216903 RepID=A0A1M6MZC3_9FLAO|nr:hypothetical protein [Epilithonimonas mollis]SHJ88845.1 hypothetical protein SAMN05444371_0072 [Epilithonimonas mollis]
MDSNLSFSRELFITYLKTLDVSKQKRMLFMIEASLTLYNDPEYDTNFGTYVDYNNLIFDKMIRNPFYKHYFRLYFHLLNKLLFPRQNELKKWESF